MSRYLLVPLLALLLLAVTFVSSRDAGLLASTAQPAPFHLSQSGGTPLTFEWAHGRVNPSLAGRLGDVTMDDSLVVSHFGVQRGGVVNAGFVVPRLSPGVYQLEGHIGQQTVLRSDFTIASRAPRANRTVTVRVFPNQVEGRSTLNTGVTLTQHTLDPWGNAASVRRGTALLTDSTAFQNQSIYGWGTLNPEPRPGHFDWSSLDQRIKLMRSMHVHIVITLCCAPDWMTPIGKNTSTYSLLAPTPQHYGDFAMLAKRIAERYPDVRYFQVWNELKGFWDARANDWNYAAYTAFYNRVYDALKSVNRRIQVGGPYLELEGSGTNLGRWSEEPAITNRDMRTLLYWLRYKHGADFITLDRTAKAVHDPLRYTPALVIQYTAWFEAIADEMHALSGLPVWWSEERFQGGPWNVQAAGLASIMYYELRGNSAVTLSWEPEGTTGNVYGGNYQNLYSDTHVPGGGRPYPYYFAMRDFHHYFPAGTRLVRTQESSRDLEVLASPRAVLLINTRPSGIVVRLNGRSFSMAGYSIKVVSLP